MVFISATHLRLRSFLYFFGFFHANESSVKELVKTPGFIGGKELTDKGLTFWTITMWDSEAAMKSFRNCTSHRKAMQKLPHWCDEAAYTHWLQEDTQLPDWETIYKKIRTEGRLTKVRKPSPGQTEKNYPPPKWKRLERKLKPASARPW